jgi:hypothetical protein
MATRKAGKSGLGSKGGSKGGSKYASKGGSKRAVSRHTGNPDKKPKK